MAWDADSPAQAAFTERVPECRAQAIAGISQDTSEAHAGGSHPIDLLNGDLRFAAEDVLLRWNPRPCHTNRIARPTLRQKQPQAHHHRHFTARQRGRDQGLAIGRLAQRGGILRGHAHRMAALLRQCRVVDHQDSVVATDKPVRLNKQFRFERCCIPRAARHEMMQLIVFARASRVAIG